MLCTKLKYLFETMELDDRWIAVPIGKASQEFRAVIRLNESAAEIFEMLKEETTEDTIVSTLKKRHGDEDDIGIFVHDMVEYLNTEGVLE